MMALLEKSVSSSPMDFFNCIKYSALWIHDSESLVIIDQNPLAAGSAQTSNSIINRQTP